MDVGKRLAGLGKVILVYALFGRAVVCSQECQGALEVDRADLVCVGRVAETTVPWSISNTHPAKLTRWTTFTVKAVLKGDASIASRSILIKTVHVAPTHGPLRHEFRPRNNRFFLAALRRTSDAYVSLGGAYEVTSTSLHLPKEVPVRDKINLVLLATLRDSDVRLASGVFWALRVEGASPDSPFYNLLEEYRRLDGHPHVRLDAQALGERLRLGDQTAVSRALALAPNDGGLGARLPGLLAKFGDDAVTTLCLVLEGELFPGRKRQAALALRKLARPASLPSLVAALDASDGWVRYFAYTAIENIRCNGGQMTSLHEFAGVSLASIRGSRLRFDSPTAHSQTLVQEMKQWWDSEGKRQFDYVLTDEGQK